MGLKNLCLLYNLEQVTKIMQLALGLLTSDCSHIGQLVSLFEAFHATGLDHNYIIENYPVLWVRNLAVNQ